MNLLENGEKLEQVQRRAYSVGNPRLTTYTGNEYDTIQTHAGRVSHAGYHASRGDSFRVGSNDCESRTSFVRLRHQFCHYRHNGTYSVYPCLVLNAYRRHWRTVFKNPFWLGYFPQNFSGKRNRGGQESKKSLVPRLGHPIAILAEDVDF